MKFEEYNWHDNPIHGFKIIESDYGSGDLVLDIDYITEWLCKEGESYNFKIAPADLIFKGVTDLEISLDYKSCTAGITPPSIHEIIREPIQYDNGYKSYSWIIAINWPTDAFIKFKGDKFIQSLRKDPVLHDEQVLPQSMRST